MDDEAMSEGLVAWLREQDALDAGTEDPRLAETDGLRDLDDLAAATGEFEVEQAPSYDPPGFSAVEAMAGLRHIARTFAPVGPAVRTRRHATLFDATLDIVGAEACAMLAELRIAYDRPDGLRFVVSWYEAPEWYQRRDVGLMVDPTCGEIVAGPVGSHPDDETRRTIALATPEGWAHAQVEGEGE